MPKTVETNHVKPLLPVAAHIEVRGRYVLDYSCLNNSFPAVSSLIPAKVVVWLVLFTGLITSASATTVIALATDHQVVMAADSRATITRKGVDSYRTICKIVSTPRAAYSMDGLAGPPRDYAEGFQLIEVVASDDVQRSMRAIEIPIKNMLMRVVPNLPRSDIQKHTEGKPLADIFGIGLEKSPVIRGITYVLRQDLDIDTIQRKVVSAYPIRPGVIEARPRNWRELSDLIPVIRAMMKAAINADSMSAEPISIVQITRAKGLEWIERGACDDQQRPE